MNSSINREHDPNAATLAIRMSQAHATPPLTLTQTPLPRMPHRLGNYEVRQELGRGGMGIVYEGFDPQLRRTVAVKVLKDSGDAEFLQRFRTEAEAVAQLQHPNIVHVYEVGWQDETPFVALEYLPGGSLHQRIGGKPKAPQYAAELVRDLAAAAAHAHEHGVVHRDLKPANILFTEQDQPKITDFGAARLLPFDGSLHDPGLTRAGEVIGTPQYMAPEQASGSQEDVGPAADIYSLGAILYEMLTGRPPFTGVDPLDVILAVRTQDPISPRKLQPKVPRDLETICLKCLEKDPRRRYPSASDLHHDFIRFLAGDAIMARPPGTLRSYWLKARRRPAAAGLIVGLVLAGIVGLAAFIWQFSLTVSALDQARKNELKANLKSVEAIQANRAMENQKQVAESNLTFAKRHLYSSLIRQSQLYSEQGKLIAAKEILDAAPEELRSWEWHNQRQQTSDVVWKYDVRLEHHDAGVCWINHLELSPDGTRIAVGFGDPYDKATHFATHNPTHIGVFDVSDGRNLLWLPNYFPTMIRHLSWSDDRTLLVGNHYGLIRLIDASHGRTVAEWPYQSDIEKDEAEFRISPNGQHIVRSSKSKAKHLELIDPTRKKPTQRFPVRSQSTVPCSISDDGRFVCLSEGTGERPHIVVYDTTTKSCCCEWQGHVPAIEFSHDGRYAAIGYGVDNHTDANSWRKPDDSEWSRISPRSGSRGSCTVAVWDTATWTCVWVRHHFAWNSGIVRFSPDDRRIAVYNTDTNTIVCYDVATGNETTTMRGHESEIRDLRFSPNGQYILTCSDDKTVRVWHSVTGQQILQYRGHDHCVRRAVFSHNGRRIISGGASEFLDCLDLSRPISKGGIMPPHETGGPGTTVGAIHFAASGRLQTLNTQTGLAEFDPTNGNPIRRIKMQGMTPRHNKELTDFGFSLDGQLLAGRLYGRTVPRKTEGIVRNVVVDTDIAVWNTETGSLKTKMVTPFLSLSIVAISPDGELVVGTGWTREGDNKPIPKIIGWNIETGQKEFEIPLDSLVASIAFSPDGQEFVVGHNRLITSDGPALRIFDRRGTELDHVDRIPGTESIINRNAFVNSVTYSRDGRKLGGVDWASNSSFVVNRSTCKLDWAIPSNTPSTSVDFSPDGRRFVTTGYDDIVHIFDVETGTEVASLKGEAGRIDDYAFPGQIRFSQDGRTLAATHWNGMFSIWHVESIGPEPIDPNRLRVLADQAAFRFHLHSAGEAIQSNDAFAYQSQLKCLAAIPPRTHALAESWNELQDRVKPKMILGGVAGGWAMDWKLERVTPWPETVARRVWDEMQKVLKTKPK